MKPVHRNRRLTVVFVCALLAIFGAFLILNALQENKQFFKHPSDVVHASYVQGEREVRVGGLVLPGTIRNSGELVTDFALGDFESANPEIPPLRVRYDQVLPDLFREGQGVVVTGKLNQEGIFIASNVLAKHDENYMPKMPEKVDYDQKS
jgi:cytochrome c-type biogenesis protein CcmE